VYGVVVELVWQRCLTSMYCGTLGFRQLQCAEWLRRKGQGQAWWLNGFIDRMCGNNVGAGKNDGVLFLTAANIKTNPEVDLQLLTSLAQSVSTYPCRVGPGGLGPAGKWDGGHW
jgi:hypothetical protein